MIGQLTFWVSTRRHTATLNDDLAWQCDDAETVEYLEKTFPVRPDDGLSNLAVGRYLLYQAATRLDGQVILPSSRRKPELV